MTWKQGQSVNVKCIAARDMPSGLANSFLVADPSVPPDGEYVLAMLRRSSIDLEPGKFYRVTFREIERQDTDD